MSALVGTIPRHTHAPLVLFVRRKARIASQERREYSPWKEGSLEKPIVDH